MKETKDLIVAIADHGLFSHVGRALSKSVKHVYYWSPWDKAFPSVTDWVIGEGFENMTRVESIWDVKKDCDLMVFPDIGFSGLQLELESQGFPVWGSRKADSLETNRGKFLKTIEELELPLPKYTTKVGLTALSEHLADLTDKWIKVSKWRGNCETWHWRSWDEDEMKMDLLACKLGPVKELITFYILDPIETDLEDGIDSYCINGIMPKLCMHGLEKKDQAYLCTVSEMKDISEIVSGVSESFAPVLGSYGYKNFFSTEVRIQGDTGYFIDPTLRCGSPVSQVMSELYGNLADIIWAGANGVCIEPEPVAQFGAQALIKASAGTTNWTKADISKEIEPWVKFHLPCKLDGKICSPPSESGEPDVGWIVAIGDSIKETLDTMNKYVDQLPEGLECNTSSLAHLIVEVQEMEKQGIEFTPLDVPEPESVLSL